MELIEFAWNTRKAVVNKIKHGVSFDEAKTVFFDECARVIDDSTHSTGEERFIILGLSAQLRILIVCHCYRESEKSIRIISARKATRKESKQYRGFSV